MATQVGWMVLEHFFSDSNACFPAIFPLMKMSRLRHLQQWQEKARDAISSQGPSPQIPPQAALAQAGVPLKIVKRK